MLNKDGISYSPTGAILFFILSALVAQLDAGLTGDREVAGSTLPG